MANRGTAISDANALYAELAVVLVEGLVADNMQTSHPSSRFHRWILQPKALVE